MKKDAGIVELAKNAMVFHAMPLPLNQFVAGQTKLKTFVYGLASSNIFASGENMHGALVCFFASDGKATDVIVKIAELNHFKKMSKKPLSQGDGFLLKSRA